MLSPISRASSAATASVIAADDGAVGQPVEVAGRLLDREILPDQPGIGAEALQLAIDEDPAPPPFLDDMTERAQRPVDLRRTHRRVPDLGQDRVVDFLDRRQRPLFGQAEPARIDQARDDASTWSRPTRMK